jgi:CheY-like chemotaxis protein
MLGRVIGEHVALEVRPDPRPQHVKVDTGQIGQVLINLAVNARDAMPGGGRLTIMTGVSSLGSTDARPHGVEPGAYVCLGVVDTGVGMPPEVAARVFEPFFTTKGEKGTGLGLATVYGIVRQAGGTIFVRTHPGEGSAFTILLPAVVQEDHGVQPPARAGRERGEETILVVEDEPQVRAIAVSMLRARGYRVLPASSGAEAFDLARAQACIDLVVSDVIMPSERGPQLVARLRQEHPRLPALYVSGYAAEAVLETDERREGFLQKPYTGRQLALQVRALLDRFELPGQPDGWTEGDAGIVVP